MMRAVRFGWSGLVRINKSGVDVQSTRIGCGSCKLVTAFVEFMARVAFDPDKRKRMRFGSLKQPLPQIDVFHGLFIGGFPAALNPAVDPVLVEGIHHILRVRVDFNLARAGKHLKCCDDAQDFHTVVGGVLVAGTELARERFAAGVGIGEHGAVAAVAGVASCRAVGVDDYLHTGPFSLVGTCSIAHDSPNHCTRRRSVACAGGACSLDGYNGCGWL